MPSFWGVHEASQPLLCESDFENNDISLSNLQEYSSCVGNYTGHLAEARPHGKNIVILLYVQICVYASDSKATSSCWLRI